MRGGSDTHRVCEGLSFYNQDDYIAVETVRLARKVVGMQDSRNGSWGSLMPRSEMGNKGKGSVIGLGRATFLAHVNAALAKVVPAVSVMPLSTVVFDYEPWVRWMVSKDDELEAEAMRTASQRRVGRMTRNSKRQDYVRWITLTDEERQSLRTSGFGH